MIGMNNLINSISESMNKLNNDSTECMDNLKSSIDDIVLQEEEHTEYKIIRSLNELQGDKISPFLYDVFNNIE